MKNASLRLPGMDQWRLSRGEPSDWKGRMLAMALVAIAMVMQACASPKAGNPAATAKPASTSAKRTPAGAIASTDLLLAEALRQYLNNRDAPQAMAMAQLAVQRSPDRADALWLELQMCKGTPGCQPEPLEAQLRKLDPTNSLVWLGPLDRALQRNDLAAADQIMEVIARSQRLELGWNAMVVKLSTALAERTRNTAPENKMPLGEGLNETVGLLSRLALPAFQPLSDMCNARRLGDKLVAARCLLVSALLQRGDTYITESMGLGIAQRLAAAETGENAKVEQRIAVARYQRDTAGEIIASQVEREKFTIEMLELMKKQRREQDVFIAIIRWSGRPLSPPPAAR